MPHQLRSALHPWGLPHLEGKDLQTARTGNLQVRRACALIKWSISARQSGYLENPATSRVWLVIQKLLRRELAAGLLRIIEVHMCAYGTPFKKPTRLLVWGRHAANVSMKLCGGRRGVCGHTGKPHLQLTGVENGRFLTHQAQIYSHSFVADFLGQLLLGRKAS